MMHPDDDAAAQKLRCGCVTSAQKARWKRNSAGSQRPRKACRGVRRFMTDRQNVRRAVDVERPLGGARRGDDKNYDVVPGSFRAVPDTRPHKRSQGATRGPPSVEALQMYGTVARTCSYGVFSIYPRCKRTVHTFEKSKRPVTWLKLTKDC